MNLGLLEQISSPSLPIAVRAHVVAHGKRVPLSSMSDVVYAPIPVGEDGQLSL